MPTTTTATPDHPQNHTQDSDPSPDPNADQTRTTEAKAAFTASLNSIGTNYDHPLRARAETLHSTEAILRAQEDQVAAATAGLGRQNGEMEGLLDGGREGLKEIGDVQNWAELLERDLLVVEEVLRDVEGDDHDHGLVDEDGEGRDGDVQGDVQGGVQTDADGPDGARAANKAKKGWLKWW